jgi:hypothetical protein
MDHRTRGFVIALASAAAGGLLPAAVQAQMTSLYLMALGLGAVVVLNTIIAFIHIKGDAERAHKSDVKTDAKTTAPYSLRAVNSPDAA